MRLLFTNGPGVVPPFTPTQFNLWQWLKVNETGSVYPNWPDGGDWGESIVCPWLSANVTTLTGEKCLLCWPPSFSDAFLH